MWCFLWYSQYIKHVKCAEGVIQKREKTRGRGKCNFSQPRNSRSSRRAAEYNFNTYHQQQDSEGMSPIPIVISLAVLVCVQLHFEVAVGGQVLWCNRAALANYTVAQRTGREALNTLSITNRYLGIGMRKCHKIPLVLSDTANECGNISLTPLDSELQGTVNAFTNLNKILYMYRSVWRNIDLSDNEFMETDSAKLDLLETFISRLSNQVEWYLQVHRCSCNHTQCTVEDVIDKNSIQQEISNLQTTTCTPKMLLHVIVLGLRNVIIDILNSLPGGPRNYDVRPYHFCQSLETLPIPCETMKFTCNTKK